MSKLVITLLIPIIVLVVAGGVYFGIVFVGKKGVSNEPPKNTPSTLLDKKIEQINKNTSSSSSAENLDEDIEVLIPPSESVVIKDSAFEPASLTVEIGAAVIFKNQDNTIHSAISEDKVIDTGVIQAGESGIAIFDEPGIYEYHCGQHPTMKGTIKVVSSR